MSISLLIKNMNSIILTHLLEKVTKPIFIDLCQGKGKRKSKEQVRKKNLYNHEIPVPNLFCFVRMPQKKQFKYPIVTQSMKRSLLGESSVERIFQQQNDTSKKNEMRLKKQKQVNEKIVKTLLHKINRDQFGNFYDTSILQNNLANFSKKKFIDQLNLECLNSSQIDDIVPRMFSLINHSDNLEKKLELNFLRFAISYECKLNNQIQLKKVKFHQQSLQNLSYNIIKMNLPEIKEIECDLNLEKLKTLTKQMHHQFVEQYFGDILCQNEFITSIQASQQFLIQLKKHKKKVKVPGQLLYQIENENCKVKQSMYNHALHLSSLHRRNRKQQRNTKNKLETKFTQIQKNSIQINHNFQQKEDLRVSKIIDQRKQPNYDNLSRIKKSRLLNFENTEFVIPNQNRRPLVFEENMQRAESKNKKLRNKESLFEKKKRELREYMKHDNPYADFSMYQYKNSKHSKRLSPLKVQLLNFRSPKQKRQKKGFKISQYPFLMGPLWIESQNQCWIEYKIETIRLKELTLKFLSDRRKYFTNNVKILIPPLFEVTQQFRGKVMKSLQILSCLGAVTLLQEMKPYRQVERKKKSIYLMVAYLMALSPAEVFERSKKPNKIEQNRD